MGGSVGAYCAKMREAGRYSAPLFRRRFPEAYRRLAFSRYDASPAGRLPRIVAGPAARLALPLERVGEWAVGRRSMPWVVQLAVVRAAAALAYAQGTLTSRTET